MRIDLKKMLFYGVPGALETFFSKAQELGWVEFIDKSQTKIKELPADIQNLMIAIKIVRTLPTMNQEALDFDTVSGRILELKSIILKLEEQKKLVLLDIEEIRPFGQFSKADIAYIEKESSRHIQYFFARHGIKNLDELPESLFYLRSDSELDYFISINNEPTLYHKMIEVKCDEELQVMQSKLESIKWNIQEAEKELKSYSKYNQFLHAVLHQKLNDFALVNAKRSVQPIMEGSIFAIEGWVPVNQIKQVMKLIQELDVQAEEIEIDALDKVPTYLENKGFARVGEDVVCFYDTPSKGDDDPSLWVLSAFAIFFAFIVGDGGYGLIFLATALYLRYKNPEMNSKSLRIWKLFMLLCVSCISWGVLTHSFFGINFAPDSIMKKFSVLDWLATKKGEYLGDITTNFADSVMIELALLFGTIHISLSFIRYIRRNPTGYGWLLAIWGGYFYFPAFLDSHSIFHYAFGFNRDVLAASGYYMMCTGLSLAVIIALIQKKWMGVLEITAVTGIFADILSYLRLYALGLSGAVVTATINDIAGSLKITFLAVILLILGHTINMALSVVGGVIHGLRLNFIEWYHYSFEGGGKAFNPLRKIQTNKESL